MTTTADLDGQGLCAQVDPELFFPSKGQPGHEARQVCAACPVRVQGRHAERVKLGAPGSVRVAELVRTCGTAAGAKRHHRAGEPVCGPCAQAHASARLNNKRGRTAA